MKESFNNQSEVESLTTQLANEKARLASLEAQYSDQVANIDPDWKKELAAEIADCKERILELEDRLPRDVGNAALKKIREMLDMG
jgi:hypothetical protein